MLISAPNTTKAMLGIIALAAVVGAANPAEARIRCDGRFQIVKGAGPIATPYCEDRFLAQVARSSYGVSTSFAAIRANVHEKERVCRMVGHDARLSDICINYTEGRDRYFSR